MNRLSSCLKLHLEESGEEKGGVGEVKHEKENSIKREAIPPFSSRNLGGGILLSATYTHAKQKSSDGREVILSTQICFPNHAAQRDPTSLQCADQWQLFPVINLEI